MSYLKKIINKLGGGNSAPPSAPLRFDVLNLETSYACNLKCRMCPRIYMEGAPGFLSMEKFEKALPYLDRFSFVFLTGYGEPLLNPVFVEQLAALKRHNKYASFATNGLLLKDVLLQKIIDAGADEITVSVDAGKAETYEYIRDKGLFSTLLNNLRAIKSRMDKGEKLPIFHWVFVMMKYNIAELPTALQLAIELGFTKFTAKHIESSQSKDGLGDALFNTKIAPDLTFDEEKLFAESLEAARAVAQKSDIRFDVHPRRFGVGNTCLVNPLSNIFIDHQGNVSSCCFLNEKMMMPYNERKPKWNGVFGNIDTPLDELLRDPRYLEFRESWSKGIPPDCCKGCLQIRRMNIEE